MAPERCHYCKNAVLEFQPTAVEHGHKYHVKCLASAQAAAETEEEKERRNAELERLKEEARKRVEEEFAKQPKIIGTIDVRTGGFVVDPRTGHRRDIPSSGVPRAPHAMEGAAH